MLRNDDMDAFGEAIGRGYAKFVASEEVLIQHFTGETKALAASFFGIDLPDAQIDAFREGLRRGWRAEREG